MDFDQCYLLVQVAGWGGKLRNFGVNDMWIQTVFPSHLFVQAICFPEYCFPGLQNQHNGGGIFHPWEALTLTLILCLPLWLWVFALSSSDAKSLASCDGAGAGSNLGSRVLGEVETRHPWVPGKGGHSRIVPSKAVCLNPGGFGEEFYNNGSEAGCW